MRAAVLALAIVAASPAQLPRFDVASVKPSTPDSPDFIFATSGPGLIAVRPGGRF